MTPDDDLITRVRSADEVVAQDAFALLFDTYWIPLCRCAFYLTGNRELSEESVADVLASLWHRRTTWAPHTSIKTYLFGAVRIHVREVRRNAVRRDTLTAYFTTEGESPAMSAPPALPDSALHRDDRVRHLRAELDALPARARAAMIYRWHEGLSYDEIAERLGMTAGAVRVLVTRTLKTLRDRLPEL